MRLINMRLIVCLCLLFVTINSSLVVPLRRLIREEFDEDYKRFMPVLKEDGRIVYEDLKNATVTLKATLSDVTYYLFTRPNRDSPIVIKNGDINQVSSSSIFDANKLTVFITHGWNNDFESPVNTLISSAVLDMYDVNVFVVDWGSIAKKFYLTAKSAVPTIGQFQGEFITSLQNTYKLSAESFVLIGHSLGAHVAGCAGATTNGKVGTIIGLDPAGPLFTFGNTNNRLDPTDGEFVHVIHTGATLWGFGSAIGDADYYPNGGDKQPGCEFDLTGTCSHGRSYRYLAESIQKNNFYGRKCTNYETYQNNSCANNTGSYMGGLYVDKTASGDYYLNTNPAKPYGNI